LEKELLPAGIDQLHASVKSCQYRIANSTLFFRFLAGKSGRGNPIGIKRLTGKTRAD
jgi:hypothetical protein